LHTTRAERREWTTLRASGPNLTRPICEQARMDVAQISTARISLKGLFMHRRGVRWCIRTCGAVAMAAAKRKGRKTGPTRAPRVSVTFPPDLYETLGDIATKKKVSIAWVVREASEKYIADQWPLFAKKQP